MVAVHCQTYSCQQPEAIICPSGPVCTWAILYSLVPDGLGLVVNEGRSTAAQIWRLIVPEQDEGIRA